MHAVRRLKQIGMAILTAAGAMWFLGTAAAQDYPSESVTIVVPFSAGGGTDTLARIVQSQLEDIWGVSVIVENRPGASGLVGSLSYLGAPADDHRILMASTGAILALAREGQGMVDGEFRVEDVLQPISQIAQPPYIATVHPDLGVDSVQELIDYAKENPGDITFGSSGVGAASHLTGVLFQNLAGVEFTHVPYNGMGEAGPALLGGEIDLLFAPAPVVEPYFADESLTPLALTTGQPSQMFPDLPNISDTLEGFSIAGWFGLFGHPGIGEEQIQTLNEGVQQALNSEAVAEAMANQGAEPAPMTLAEYQDFVNNDIAMWLELLEMANQD